MESFPDCLGVDPEVLQTARSVPDWNTSVGSGHALFVIYPCLHRGACNLLLLRDLLGNSGCDLLQRWRPSCTDLLQENAAISTISDPSRAKLVTPCALLLVHLAEHKVSLGGTASYVPHHGARPVT
jgi:hypothetical protein